MLGFHLELKGTPLPSSMTSITDKTQSFLSLCVREKKKNIKLNLYAERSRADEQKSPRFLNGVTFKHKDTQSRMVNSKKESQMT